MRLVLIVILLLTLSCKQTNQTQLTKITAKTTVVDSTYKSSHTIDIIVAPYKEQLNAQMKQQLSYAPMDFIKSDGAMQSTLGNLVADLCFEMANPVYHKISNKSIDFVLFNHGGLRSSITKGLVTTETAFKVMPFENELVVVRLKGKKIKEMMAYLIENQRAHPLSKNVSLSIKGSEYVLKINGQPFDENSTYGVLTNDFLQNGGDKMIFFAAPEELTPLNYKFRDALLDYFKMTDTLEAEIDNRVIQKI